MKPKTTEEVFELLDGYIISTVLGTAMELGYYPFWQKQIFNWKGSR